VFAVRAMIPAQGTGMSLVLDIGTGAGLAGATGVRPYLPPLLAGALARGDVGIDFDGTDWSFLESPGFLAAVLALAVVAYLLERSRAGRPAAAGDGPRARDPVVVGAGILGLALGALLFAGALADGGHESWLGLVLGPLCAALAWLAVGGLVERARARLDPETAAYLTVFADLAALVLAAIAIFVSPLSFLALLGFAFLLVAGRRREGEKYAGLRILR
jgi:hypothetical protein